MHGYAVHKCMVVLTCVWMHICACVCVFVCASVLQAVNSISTGVSQFSQNTPISDMADNIRNYSIWVFMYLYNQYHYVASLETNIHPEPAFNESTSNVLWGLICTRISCLFTWYTHCVTKVVPLFSVRYTPANDPHFSLVMLGSTSLSQSGRSYNYWPDL